MKRHIGWGLGGCTIQSFLAPFPWNKGVSGYWHDNMFVVQLGSFDVQSFIGVSWQSHGWLNHWPCNWTQISSPPLLTEGQLALVSNLLSMWLIFLVISFLPKSTHLLSINSSDLRGPWIAKTLLLQGKFHEFRVFQSQQPGIEVKFLTIQPCL